MKYEYQTHYIAKHKPVTAELLNEYGAQGFRLVDINEFYSDVQGHVRELIFVKESAT